MWPTMTPLRQFPGCPREVSRKLKRLMSHGQRTLTLILRGWVSFLGCPNMEKRLQSGSKVPTIGSSSQVQPVTRSMLRVELTITPKFEWDESIHGTAESFWILVEDCDGEEILFHDVILLRQDYAII